MTKRQPQKSEKDLKEQFNAGAVTQDDPLVIYAGFTPQQAHAIRRTAQLIVQELRSPEFPIFEREPDNRVRVDLRRAVDLLSRLPKDVQSQVEADAHVLNFDLNLRFLSTCLMALLAYDPDSVGIDLGALMKQPRKMGRPRRLTPVSTLIGQHGLRLRENTDLAWPDIAQRILDNLKEQQHHDSIEEDAIQRLTSLLTTQKRDHVGTFVQRVVREVKARAGSMEVK